MRMLAALAVLLAPPAWSCTIPPFGDMTLEIRDDRLLARRGGAAVGRASLPVLERDWSCRRAIAFPDKGELFIEWDQGLSGEAITFNRVTLLSYAIGEGVREMRRWTLYQAYREGGEDLVQVRQAYRLIPTGYGVRVILESD